MTATKCRIPKIVIINHAIRPVVAVGLDAVWAGHQLPDAAFPDAEELLDGLVVKVLESMLPSASRISGSL